MKIFITGAAGFIGSHLWDYYEKKAEIKGIDNFSHACMNPRNNRVDYGDIRYYQDVEDYIKWADVVFHLAAQIHVDKSITNPEETLDTNIKGTLNILEAVKKYNKKMVFASSSEVYGSEDINSKLLGYGMSETHPLNGQSPYAASKIAGDRLCYSYWKTYGTKIAILRNFNTFGEYQNDGSYGGVIAIFTRNALKNKPLRIFGKGNQKRDYMHVQDAVKGYEFCINKKLWGNPVNIGTGNIITITELAYLIKKITKSKSKIIHVKPRPGEVEKLKARIDFAKSKGFKIKTNFEENLTNYIKWYEKTFKQNKKVL